MVFSKVFAPLQKSNVHSNVQASLVFFWKVRKRNGFMQLKTDYFSSSILIKLPPRKCYPSFLFLPSCFSEFSKFVMRKKHERETKLVCILCSFPLKNIDKLKAPQAFLQIDCIRIQESKE